jgi:hypothetical protein
MFADLCLTGHSVAGNRRDRKEEEANILQSLREEGLITKPQVTYNSIILIMQATNLFFNFKRRNHSPKREKGTIK